MLIGIGEAAMLWPCCAELNLGTAQQSLHSQLQPV